MNWPLPQDFNEAVQNPASAFSDPDLKTGQAIIGPQGLPLPRSGNFADVYQIRAADGRDWGVKCFTRPVTGLEQRYAKVDAALQRAGLPFTIGFTFQTEGVRVRGQWLPAVKMEWVDGLLLNQVVRDQAGNPKVLDALCQMWARLCKRLREAGVAHADLQHGNVLLVPGSRPGAYGLKLIDYDGMYLPTLANNPSGEAGHPNYQHPTRATKQVYSPDLDRFPHLVIATALKGLAVLGTGLWERYDTGDNLLFTDEDFVNPAGSRLMRELWQANNPGLQALVGHLAVACGRPVPQTPWLDQVAPDGIAIPLSPAQHGAAAAALGFAPPVALVPEIQVVTAVSPDAFGVAPPPAPLPAPVAPAFDLPVFEAEADVEPRRRNPTKPATSPVLIVGGVFLLLAAVTCAIIGGIVLLGGKSPDETAQTQTRPDDSAEKTPPKPREKEKDKSAPPLAVVGPKPPDNPIVPPPTGPLQPVAPAQPGGLVDVAALPPLPVRWEKSVGVPDGISRMAFASDSKSLAVASYGRKDVRVLNAKTGIAAGVFTGHEAPVLGVAALPGGAFASLAAGDGFALVWDPAALKSTAKILCPELPLQKPESFLYTSADGRYLVCGGTESDTGQPAATPPPPIEVTDTETGQKVMSFRMSWGVARFTGDSTRLVVADDRTGLLRVFRLPSGQLTEVNTGEQAALAVAVSPDGRSAVYLGKADLPGGQGFNVHDVATGRLVRTIPIRPTAGFRSGFSPDGKWLALVHRLGAGSQVVLVDTATWAPVAVATAGVTQGIQWDHGLRFSPDGKILAVPKAGGRVIAFDLPPAGGSSPKMPDPLVAIGPKPGDPDPKPKDPDPKPKDPDPKPKDPDPKPKDPDPKVTPKPVERIPVPDDAAVAQAGMQVREKFKDEYARKSMAEKKVFAHKLIGLADQPTTDPAARYVMFRDARDLAVETAEPVLAAEAVDAWAKAFAVTGGELKHLALEKIRDASTTPAALRVVAEVALAGSDTAVAADEYKAATKLARTAADAARGANLSAAVVDEAETEVVRTRKAGAAFDEIASSLGRLKTNPDDADAAFAVGKFRCFSQGRWAEGINLLTKGGASALKTVAELDAATPPEGGPDVKAADAWWDYAQTAPAAEKRAAEARARHWYVRALPKLTGDQKAQAEARLALRYNMVDYRPGLVAEFTAKVPSILQGKKARVDPVVTFSGGEFSDSGVGRATDLTVKWTGVIVPPRVGRYRLIANATDPVRVRIDGKAVIDTLSAKTAKREGVVSLPDHPCPVTIEFPCINTERHQIKLFWAHAGTGGDELVPPDVLFHDRKTDPAAGK